MTPHLDFVLKIASRCNLNCDYCYVYNKGDESWRSRPSLMRESTFLAALYRIRRHCLKSRQPNVRLIFHGGEPCLVGPSRLSRWCGLAREALGDITRVAFSIQTNGTLLDKEWIDVLLAHRINVSLSVDGPKDVHDRSRPDHHGNGSFDATMLGISLLKEAGVPLHVLSVVDLGGDGLRTHRFLMDIGITSVNYLLPDFTDDTIGPVRQRFGPTPCADYLLPIMEHWWANGFIDTRVSIFWHMAGLILGGRSAIDAFGNRPFNFVFIEADGGVEGLDVLRICQPAMAATGLNVFANDFTEVVEASDIHRAAIFEGFPLPSACAGCRERTTCAGGYLPHRHSVRRGFDNPTVWCSDVLRLFGRLRELLEVTPRETLRRRRVIARAVHEAPAGADC